MPMTSSTTDSTTIGRGNTLPRLNRLTPRLTNALHRRVCAKGLSARYVVVRIALAIGDAPTPSTPAVGRDQAGVAIPDVARYRVILIRCVDI